MADTNNLNNFLTDIADAIRSKKNGSKEPIFAANFDIEIRSIETGINTSDATAKPEDILYPKTAYVDGEKITGNIHNEYYSKTINELKESNNITFSSNVQDVTLEHGYILTGARGGNVVRLSRFDNNVIGEKIYEFNVNNITNTTGYKLNSARISKNTDSAGNLTVWLAFGGGDVNAARIRVIHARISPSGSVSNICHYYENYTWSRYNVFNLAINPADNKQAFISYMSGAIYDSYIHRYTCNGSSISMSNLGTTVGSNTAMYTELAVDGSGIMVADTTDSYSRLKYNRVKYVGLTSIVNRTVDVNGMVCLYKNHLGFINNTLYNFSSGTTLKTFSDIEDVRNGIQFCNGNKLIRMYDGKLFIYKIVENSGEYSLEEIYTNYNFASLTTKYNYLAYAGTPNSPSTNSDVYIINNGGVVYLTNRDEKVYTNVILGDNVLYNTEDSTANEYMILEGQTAYNNLGKITGAMTSIGSIDITPSTENKYISEGYTTGGVVRGERNLLPKNIKKNVDIFGVVGTLETDGGSGKGDVKLFETTEDMQNDTSSVEGDMAIVYRSNIQNMTSNSIIQVVNFPDKVVLPLAFTEYVNINLSPVEEWQWADCRIRLDSNSFSIDMMGTEMFSVIYESSDGITYNLINTDGLSNPVDLGLPLKLYEYDKDLWNDAVGYFIQTGGMYFDGLYEAKYLPVEGLFNPIMTSGLTFDKSSSSVSNAGIVSPIILDLNKINKLKDEIVENESLSKNVDYNVFTNNGNIYLSQTGEKMIFDNSGKIIGTCIGYKYGNFPSAKVYLLDLDNMTYTFIQELTSSKLTLQYYTKNGVDAFYYDLDTMPFSLNRSDNISGLGYGGYITYNDKQGYYQEYYIPYIESKIYDTQYVPASTQLTLSNSDYLLSGKNALGMNGAIKGTLGDSVSPKLDDTIYELYLKAMAAYNTPVVLPENCGGYFIGFRGEYMPQKFNTSNVVDMSGMFSGCMNLLSLDLRDFDTSNVVDMTEMFNSCNMLQSLDLSSFNCCNVTNMCMMFGWCPGITNIDLSSFNAREVTNMEDMFYYCSSLETLDLSGIEPTSNTSTRYMFYGCESLKTVYVKNEASKTIFDDALSKAGRSVRCTIKTEA